ncbi:hypothetical protein G6F64_014483 [Rhizopus arrhizus]|uniref:Uncharacterized protein n=1 Tax=Rhizopus oryzae TaxID=64495 RepID=A0A9P6WTY1_RHIOR|nr:hypothetical protein G6F64_014483 [Rhizopus arrhizus]
MRAAVSASPARRAIRARLPATAVVAPDRTRHGLARPPATPARRPAPRCPECRRAIAASWSPVRGRGCAAGPSGAVPSAGSCAGSTGTCGQLGLGLLATGEQRVEGIDQRQREAVHVHAIAGGIQAAAEQAADAAHRCSATV